MIFLHPKKLLLLMKNILIKHLLLLTLEKLYIYISLVSLQDYSHWDIVDFLPSYGRGIGRYRSLIYGQNLSDVVITGKNFLFTILSFNYFSLRIGNAILPYLN